MRDIDFLNTRRHIRNNMTVTNLIKTHLMIYKRTLNNSKNILKNQTHFKKNNQMRLRYACIRSNHLPPPFLSHNKCVK